MDHYIAKMQSSTTTTDDSVAKDPPSTTTSMANTQFTQATTPAASTNHSDYSSNYNNYNPQDSIDSLQKDSTHHTLQNIAATAGNVLEWYDFAVFGYFSDVIGELFFPLADDSTAIVESFTVFGIAFLMRPLGGLMMGYIGDKVGRKKALELSIFLMAIPTFFMGLLPTYAEVGKFSTVLLVFVRMLQGLSVGGQLVSSLVYTCENNPPDQMGFYGSLVGSGANFGTLLGSVVAFLLRKNLDPLQLREWGWRLPFISGILVTLCGVYLKYYCDDEAFNRLHPEGTTCPNPIKATFKKGNRVELLAASLIPMLWAGGFYISFVWMATFMGELLQPPVPDAFFVNSLSLLISVCLFFPVAGSLADTFGKRNIMLIGAIGLMSLSPLFHFIISLGNDTGAFFAQCGLGFTLSLYGAPMGGFLVQSFPPQMRLTSIAFSYNIAHAIVGGSSPALATYLEDKYGEMAPGYVITVISIFSLIGLYIAPQFRDHLEGEDDIEFQVSRRPVQNDVGLSFHDRDAGLVQQDQRVGRVDQRKAEQTVDHTPTKTENHVSKHASITSLYTDPDGLSVDASEDDGDDGLSVDSSVQESVDEESESQGSIDQGDGFLQAELI